MALWYVDFAAGNNANAGTSWGTAKKDISAVTPANGDTIKVAKSPDPTTLSGTLAWVDGSATVNTSADLTGVLAAKDMVGKAADGSDGWWEISSITSSAITLVSAYAGTTATVTSRKLGVFDVGSPASSSTNIQATPSVNVTAYDAIAISGGWNTGTDLIDGYSHYWVSGATKNGRFSVANSGYTISRIGMHRCSAGFNVTGSFNKFQSVWTSNTSAQGLSFQNSMNEISGMVAVGCVISVNATNLGGLVVDNARILNSGSTAVTMANGPISPVVSNCTIIRGNTGISFSGNSSDGVASGCTIRNCAVGVQLENARNMVVNCTMSANTTADISGAEGRVINCALNSTTKFATTVTDIRVDHHQQVVGDHRTVRLSGTMLTNTVDRRGGSGKCLEMQPNDTGTRRSRFLEQRFPIPLSSGVTRNFSQWIKKSAGWNGSKVYVGIQTRGAWVTGPTDISGSLTTSYQEFTDLYLGIADEVAELVIQADGSAGSIFVDDVSWT